MKDDRIKKLVDALTDRLAYFLLGPDAPEHLEDLEREHERNKLPRK